MESDLFSYEDARDAIAEVFPTYAYDLICKFDQMLVMDCVLGVNDRHFYNWGIITDVTGKRAPRFAPLYDTSRGLLWNFSEEKVKTTLMGKHEQVMQLVEKYIHSSHPKLSCPGLSAPSHFQFMEKLGKDVPGIRKEAEPIIKTGVEPLIKVLHSGFGRLMSDDRRQLIEMILRERFSLTSRCLNL
jgi:hypothetical protein